jgi:YVTN family beta-propeller protein
MGKRAFSTDGLSNSISVIDLVTAKVIATVPTGVAPWGVAVAP